MNGVGNVNFSIAVGVASADRIGCGSAVEYVSEQVYRVRDVDHVITVGVSGNDDVETNIRRIRDWSYLC